MSIGSLSINLLKGLHGDRGNRCSWFGNRLAVFAERIHMHEDCFTYQFFNFDTGIRCGDTTR